MSVIRKIFDRKPSVIMEESDDTFDDIPELKRCSLQGWLHKKQGLKPKKYYCTLQGYFLSFWKNYEEHRDTVLKGAHRSSHWIDISLAHQVLRSNNSRTPFGFDIITNRDRTTLIAGNRQDMDMWIDTLQDAMQLRGRAQSLRASKQLSMSPYSDHISMISGDSSGTSVSTSDTRGSNCDSVLNDDNDDAFLLADQEATKVSSENSSDQSSTSGEEKEDNSENRSSHSDKEPVGVDNSQTANSCTEGDAGEQISDNLNGSEPDDELYSTVISPKPSVRKADAGEQISNNLNGSEAEDELYSTPISLKPSIRKAEPLLMQQNKIYSKLEPIKAANGEYYSSEARKPPSPPNSPSCRSEIMLTDDRESDKRDEDIEMIEAQPSPPPSDATISALSSPPKPRPRTLKSLKRSSENQGYSFNDSGEGDIYMNQSEISNSKPVGNKMPTSPSKAPIPIRRVTIKRSDEDVIDDHSELKSPPTPKPRDSVKRLVDTVTMRPRKGSFNTESGLDSPLPADDIYDTAMAEVDREMEEMRRKTQMLVKKAEEERPKIDANLTLKDKMETAECITKLKTMLSFVPSKQHDGITDHMKMHARAPYMQKLHMYLVRLTFSGRD